MVKQMKNKGQMFLIMALVIIIVIVMLKISLNLTKIMEDKRYLEAGLERLEFQNIRNELIKTVQISYSQPENISQNVNEFARFARDSYFARAIDIKGIFLQTLQVNVTSGELARINVTVLNAMDAEINTLNLTFNGTEQIFRTIANMRSINTNFTFTGGSYNFTLTMFYNTSYENATERIIIPTEAGKQKATAFFDIRMITSRAELRDKFTESYTL